MIAFLKYSFKEKLCFAGYSVAHLQSRRLGWGQGQSWTSHCGSAMFTNLVPVRTLKFKGRKERDLKERKTKVWWCFVGPKPTLSLVLLCCCCFETGSLYGDQAGLQLTQISLPLPPTCWSQRTMSSLTSHSSGSICFITQTTCLTSLELPWWG